MRISDWSSDVCSSDLLVRSLLLPERAGVEEDRDHHIGRCDGRHLHDADRFRMDQAKEGQRPADRRERRRLHQFPVNYHPRDRSQEHAGQPPAMAQYLTPPTEPPAVAETTLPPLYCLD